MPLNQSFVGRTYTPDRTYEVGREKIREFATAIGDTSPLCRDVQAARAAGYPDVIAPPTFPIIVALDASTTMISDPDFGLDYSRVVHGEQRFVYTRPVHAGDVLRVTATIESIRAAAGNEIIGTREDITTESGEHVVTSYSLVVARGTAQDR